MANATDNPWTDAATLVSKVLRTRTGRTAVICTGLGFAAGLVYSTGRRAARAERRYKEDERDRSSFRQVIAMQQDPPDDEKDIVTAPSGAVLPVVRCCRWIG